MLRISPARKGRFVQTSTGGESVRAFVPPPLPPAPPVDLLAQLKRLGDAERALGRLDGITVLLPRHDLFLYMYVRKEAVLSSQIEGTQSTLTDLLRFESEARAGEPVDDIREVSNYVDAMMFGVERLATLPLSLRLIREMHARLLHSGRGAARTPGEFRRSQNWIGGTQPGNALFVPPPVDELPRCLAEFEAFLHEEASGLPVLVKAALLHVQFETIHPFLDGNGRIGRLLITLYLCHHGVLRQPLLYLSLYLKTHRTTYYRLLQDVRETGRWEGWLDFFLTGVAETADQAFESAIRIVDLFRADRERISAEAERTGSVLRIHEQMKRQPYVSPTHLGREIGLTPPTVNSALAKLERLGVVEEITGRKRGRVFAYREYARILSEGTAPLGAGPADLPVARPMSSHRSARAS